jgi:hypothetical protein
MQENPQKTGRFPLPGVSVITGSLIVISVACLIGTFVKTDDVSPPHLLIPSSPAPNLGAPAAATPTPPTVSPHWIIKHFGQCCEGNLAAQGPSTYVLLPILLTGNQIWRSDDNGINWAQKYPPANASIPFGIEGDLQAFGNDINYFGTLVAQGVAAHSSDRGQTWTTVPIPVAFPANDQAWSYLGPFSLLPAQPLAPYVLTGWYRIGSVALFSFDGGLTWPIQTPLPGVDGSGSMHVVCEQTAHAPTSPGDTRNPNADFVNHKAGHYGCWGTDRQFYWTEPVSGNLYVCKTNNFGATWTGIKHPIVAGPGSGYVTSHAGFDNKGTLYVLHGDKLYVSFNQGEDFAFVHTLPRWGNALLGDPGSDQFFVVNCGTIHIGLAEAAGGTTGGNTNIWYLRGSNVDTANPTWDQELVDVVGNDRLDFMQIVINGNNIPTISYTAPGVEVTTASRDAPLPPNDTCSGTIIDKFVSAVSRKTHGSAGAFDILLPLAGSPGIECRTGPQSGSHDVVITFVGPATVTTATCNGSPATTSASGNDVTVHCTGVPNAAHIQVTLDSVTVGGVSGSLSVPMDVLLGDVNANGLVDSGDVFLVRQQTGQSAALSNFREDVNATGVIDSGDVFLTRQETGTALP